jgi:hypothetical protein
MRKEKLFRVVGTSFVPVGTAAVIAAKTRKEAVEIAKAQFEKNAVSFDYCRTDVGNEVGELAKEFVVELDDQHVFEVDENGDGLNGEEVDFGPDVVLGTEPINRAKP